MDKEFHNIVQRLAVLEGRITPVTVKHGLNPQQKAACLLYTSDAADE